MDLEWMLEAYRRTRKDGAVGIDGQTAQEESTDITIEERSDRVAYMPGAASLTDIVDALNLLGVGASDLVVILESLKQAGSLQAEMVVL